MLKLVTAPGRVLPCPLMTGKSLAHYQVIEKLGAGGMGEVWRARDTRLGRDVAIKVLPALFAEDAERMARFEREAGAAGLRADPLALRRYL